MIKLQLVTFLLFLSWNPLFGQFNKPWETYKEEDDLDPEENKILNVDLHTWQQHFNEKQKLLVVFYRDENCLKCKDVLDSLYDLLGQPEMSGVQIGKSNDKQLIRKVGVTNFPSLAYLRDKSHVFYDGDFQLEDMVQWSMMASKKTLKWLDDDSFEHLTQASSGATTGDWLVAFYTDRCKEILPMMETLGVRIQGKTNVAKVNAAANYDLVDRFNIKTCPEVILFKSGKMYRYTLNLHDAASLKNFVNGFYKNVKAETVPVPGTTFDHLTENIADAIQSQIEGENGQLILAGGVGASVLLLVIVVCCLRSKSSPGGKKKKKTKKE